MRRFLLGTLKITIIVHTLFVSLRIETWIVADQFPLAVGALQSVFEQTSQDGSNCIDVWAFRAGFAYYGNPYATGDLDGSRKFYSAGLGYRNKGFYADLTYVYMNQNLLDQPYLVGTDQPNTPSPAPAAIKANTSNVSLGIGFKF